MAQLLLHGTNFVNFLGFNAWVGEADDIEAVRVTEWEEPQAVIGSYLHRYAYPDWYREHVERDRRLPDAYGHDSLAAQCIQLYGENEEQPMHPIYNYAYITDSVEGLIVTNVNTLQDQEPRNNFFTRALTWNEGGILNGARHVAIAGTRFFVSADAGVIELDMNDPLHPRVI